jgi:type I restriction enzyme, S subunit
MSLLNSSKLKKLPLSWNLKQIGEVLIDSQYGINEPAIESGNTRIVGMKDLQNGKVIIDQLTSAYLPKEKRVKYLLHRGNLLINRTNSYDLVGKVGIFESDEEVAFASYLIRLVVDDSKIASKFLNYWLNCQIAQAMIKRIATRAVSQANINPTELKRHCLVPIPPHSEQNAISALLYTWDQIIEKTERIISAKVNHFSWLIKSLISDKCNHWEHIKSKTIFDSISDKGYGHEELLSVTQDRGVIPRSILDGRVMSPEGSVESYKLIKDGDFAISLRSFQGGIEYSKFQGLISPAYTVLRAKLKIVDDFYRHFFKSYIFIERYLSIAVIGIRDGKQISIPDFMTVKIPYPSIETQRKIADILNTAQKEIDLLKKQLDAYRKQKRGLMQKLLTGQWRVKINQQEDT